MMFIDTHTHILEEEASEYYNNAIEANVKIMLTASEDLKTSLEAVRIANEFPNVFACIGVHPSDAKDFKDEDIDKFRELCKDNKVVAIGEIGLDYYYGKEDKDRQIEVFKMFLSLALEVDLPVVIHTREATFDTINILKEYNVKGVIHCFNGSIETAREYMKLGFSFGIGGVLTFKNSKLFETVKEIPLDKIVLETDSPYLTPEPYRGKKNESKYIPIIAECLAKHTGKTLEEIAEITTNNAKRIFNI